MNLQPGLDLFSRWLQVRDDLKDEPSWKPDIEPYFTARELEKLFDEHLKELKKGDGKEKQAREIAMYDYFHYCF